MVLSHPFELSHPMHNAQLLHSERHLTVQNPRTPFSLHQLLDLDNDRGRVETLEGDLLGQSTAPFSVGTHVPVPRVQVSLEQPCAELSSAEFFYTHNPKRRCTKLTLLPRAVLWLSDSATRTNPVDPISLMACSSTTFKVDLLTRPISIPSSLNLSTASSDRYSMSPYETMYPALPLRINSSLPGTNLYDPSKNFDPSSFRIQGTLDRVEKTNRMPLS